MDRAKFEAALEAGAVKLVPYTPPGFKEPIYLLPMSLADVKAELLRPVGPKEVPDLLRKDEFYIERRLAHVLRSADGALLYDEKDDAQMGHLRKLLDKYPPGLSNSIHEAHNGINNKATKDEVDTEGN